MRLIKEVIHRRIPHIIGSYLIAGTSLILFVDCLVNSYTLPEYYTTLCLFGVIAIIPSVLIEISIVVRPSGSSSSQTISGVGAINTGLGSIVRVKLILEINTF